MKGRKRFSEKDFNAESILAIYEICVLVHNNKLTMNEGADEMKKVCQVSKASAYKLMCNFSVMLKLMEDNVPQATLLEVDEQLKVYNLIVAGRELSKRKGGNQ